MRHKLCSLKSERLRVAIKFVFTDFFFFFYRFQKKILKYQYKVSIKSKREDLSNEAVNVLLKLTCI